VPNQPMMAPPMMVNSRVNMSRSCLADPPKSRAGDANQG
jgi:hypothetical protein